MLGDNIQWTYTITVGSGMTVSLAHFTIVATTRAAAIAAANTLVTQTAFGEQAASYLSDPEIKSLANFLFYAPPTDIILYNDSIVENSLPNSVVGTLGTVDDDANTLADDSFTYSLVPGTSGTDTDNAAFTINSNQLMKNNIIRMCTRSIFKQT